LICLWELKIVKVSARILWLRTVQYILVVVFLAEIKVSGVLESGVVPVKVLKPSVDFRIIVPD
jgi:hypothetical protein